MHTQEEIDVCLNCTLPDCVNCLSGGGRVYQKHQGYKLRIAEYAKLGLSDKDMGILLGIHANTVARLRQEMGVEKQRGGSRRGRPRKNVPDVLRQHDL